MVVGDVRPEPDYRATKETEDGPLRAVRAALLRRATVGRDQPRERRARTPSTRTTRGWSPRSPARLSAALRSARLFAQLEAAYLDTAEALAAALEAKDSYTASHSRSIAEHAEAVGRALGLDGDELRTLRFGAAFHDIGKLAIPEAILNKTAAARRRRSAPRSSSTR